MTNLNDMLEERGNRYGDFSTHAKITVDLKNIITSSRSWSEMEPYHQEALAMIAHKIGRICNGDPDYIDSWQDIAGYAQLVADLLESKGR